MQHSLSMVTNVGSVTHDACHLGCSHVKFYVTTVHKHIHITLNFLYFLSYIHGIRDLRIAHDWK
jgi:hypothetical protein